MQQRLLLAHSEDWLGVSRIPALFARAGLATTLVGRSSSLVARSRFVSEFIEAPREIPAFIETVRSMVETQGDRFAWVLLADDALVAAAAQHAGEAWLDRCFPVDHRSAARRFVSSKFEFLEACRAAGLPMPRSAVVRGVDAARAFARELGYPVMVKRGAGTGGQGVRKVADEAELVAAIEAFRDPEINIEEFVRGVVGATEALYDRGNLIAWCSLEKRKRYPAEYGPSAVRRIFEPPGVVGMLRACGEVTGWTGFAAICWMYDPDAERLALLEMNPRQGSGVHLVPAPARIFAGGIRAIIDGRSAAYRFEPARADQLYRMFPQDLQRAIDQRDIGGILWWTPGLPSARDIPWNDLQLLRSQVRHLLFACFPRTMDRLAHLRQKLLRQPALSGTATLPPAPDR